MFSCFSGASRFGSIMVTEKLHCNLHTVDLSGTRKCFSVGITA